VGTNREANMNLFESLLSIVMAVLIAYMVAYAIVQAKNNVICLENGYKHTSLTWDFKGYCIKRVDQTDVVTALEDL